MNNQKTNRVVNRAVDWAVYGAVDWTIIEDSPHPALQDFLNGIGEAS